MAPRLPASQRAREEPTALIEGRLFTASAKDKPVRLATSGMAPLICWSFSSPMFRYFLFYHAVPAT